MSVILYINGQQADLAPDTVIAQTRQVNDLNSLSNRQAGYTNKFKLPKTAHNIKIMDFLTLAGNDSAIPYQKNECSLYSASGECFVYKGWAVITDGGDAYEAVIYDGIVDLYKLIENKKMSDLTLTELNHTKNLQNVTASWDDSNNLKYRYILADYNGEKYTPQLPLVNQLFAVNLDYLIPSARVKYLWDTIFSAHGFTCSGSIFENPDFTNLWLTYSKGVATEDLNNILLEADTPAIGNLVTHSYNGWPQNYYTLIYTNTSINTLPDNNAVYWRAPQPGRYRLTISGNLPTPHGIQQVYLAKNAGNIPLYSTTPFVMVASNVGEDGEIDTTVYADLQQNDTLCLVIRLKAPGGVSNHIHFEDAALQIQFSQVGGNEINFQEGFEGLSIKDFLNEIIYRFGLTMYKDKFSTNYHFLTLKEQLQAENIEDYSDKFNRKVTEKYELGGYAQQNWFKYKYANEDETYYDAKITVYNQNLEAEKDILKSKIYAPDKDTGTLFNYPVNVYRFWDKEIKKDEESQDVAITYKPLTRYYFLKHVNRDISPAMVLRSAAYNQQQVFTKAPFETFNKLPFYDILQDYYYSPLQSVLSNTCMITAELWLSDVDVSQFDFKKLYYIQQLSSYFVMNKITNYIPGKPVKCDMLRVLYNPEGAEPTQPDGIIITGINALGSNKYSVTFQVNNYTVEEDTNLLFESSANGELWEDTNNPTKVYGGIVVVDLTGHPQWYIRIRDSADTYSNIFAL